MFQQRSIAIILSLYIMSYHIYALPSCSNECAIETRVNCKTHCDTDTPKCPDSHNIFNKTFLFVRPQDSNAARRIQVGRTRAELFYEGFCTKVNLAFEWQQSFNNSKIAKWFSFNCNKCMTIGIPGNGLTFDIDGTQLGLGTVGLVPGPIGTICFSPKAQNFIADLDIQVNLDNYLCGLWARMDLPIVWTKRNLGLKILDEQATGSFPPGTFTTDCTTTPTQTIAAALQENMCGKITNKNLTKVGVAGIHFDLGYDFVNNACGNFGVSLHLVTPTGTRPKACYLFEPIIGANRCFQIGGNVNASYNIYWGCNEDRNVSFMLDATLTHLFKSRQRRLFALKNNGAGSQLLLLKRFNAIGTTVLGLDSVANVLCGQTKIGADFMFDGAVMMQINRCNVFCNLGYNLWYRSKEKRGRIAYLNNFGENNLGIKGNQPLSEILPGPCLSDCRPDCINDVTTASGSTIGQPAAPDATTTFITLADIDFCAPLNPHALSNKFFGSLGYNWDRCGHPCEILIGGEVEFGQHNSALNQWGVLIKGGVAF